MNRVHLRNQTALLQQCVNEDLDLDLALSAHGLTIEELRYRLDDARPTSRAKYMTTEDLVLPRNGIAAVSFFSGAGGLDLGFEAAGFEHLASFESSELFCGTIKQNRPKWNVFNEDLSQRERVASILRDRLGINVPFDGVFHGGPPCQSFSVAANQRFSKSGNDFKRVGFAHESYGSLLSDYVWYILKFQPRAFLIENVPGLADVDGGVQLRGILSPLADAGYSVTLPTILNASAFGVPQDRKRLFVAGFHGAKNLPNFGSDQREPIPCFKAFERSLAGVSNHIVRNHKAESVLRYMELSYGKRDRLGRVDRLDPRVPSKTVIAGGLNGGGRSHLHPDIPRTLSPREAARLQTFPDGYIFSGPAARQLTQVGNAVPPVLAHHIASVILAGFEENSTVKATLINAVVEAAKKASRRGKPSLARDLKDKIVSARALKQRDIASLLR